MSSRNSSPIRRTAICVATALAIALPGAASAGVLDKAKSRVQSVASTVKAKRPVANALRDASRDLPAVQIIEMIKELDLKSELENSMDLLREMQADYRYFAGGLTGCEAECKAFRKELKDTFSDFLWLAEDVPALRNSGGLIEKIERVLNLIDYMPPRALYLMWQALDGRLNEIRTAVDGIGQVLESLPPLVDVSDIAASVNDSASKVADSRVCEWAAQDDMPYVELVQAKLEMLAWSIGKVESFIPDVEIKAEAGGEAGAAVANATAAAGAGVKVTDPIKIALQVVATIPETINWAIKLNILQAKVVCDAAGRVATTSGRLAN